MHTPTDCHSVAAAAAPAASNRRGRTALGWGLHALVVAGAAGSVALDRHLRRRRATAKLPAPAIVTVAFFGLLTALEIRRPYRDDWRPGRAEVMTDTAFVAAGALLQTAGLTATAPLLGAARRDAGLRRLPDPLAVVITVLAFDLAHSRVHQLFHVWGPGWRLHSVHHSPKRLYALNATRFQAIDMFLDYAIEALIVSCLGLSHEQHVAYQTVRGMYGQLQHSNVELRSGALDFVFSTPDLHRWHHSEVYDEGDTDYGAITSVWDQLFGTFFRPEDRDGPAEIGVGRMPDFPQRFWELQRVPADWVAIRTLNAPAWNTEE